MRHIPLPGTDRQVSVFGQGTYRMGRDQARRTREVEALRLGISLGMTLIDTAEFYGAGEVETMVGDAVADCRERVFLVDKLWPSHAGYRDAIAAVRGMLRRLRTEYLDGLLLHWPTRSVPVAETLRAFDELRRDGTVRHVGVSNFDAGWLAAAEAAAPDGLRLTFNQIPYSLVERGAENAVLPWMRARGMLAMAYRPLATGGVAAGRGAEVLRRIADAHGAAPEQVALAFAVAAPGVVAIPKAVDPAHVRANAAAGDLQLTAEEIAALDAAFPRNPRAKLPALPGRTAFFRLVMAANRRGLRL